MIGFGADAAGWIAPAVGVLGGGLSPLLAAVVVGVIANGWWPTFRAIRSGFTGRVGPGLYALAVLAPLAALGKSLIATGERPAPPDVSLASVILQATWMAPAIVLAENLGWRFWLQRGLQRLTFPVPAGLLTGSVWGIWHLPLFLPTSGSIHSDLPIGRFCC